MRNLNTAEVVAVSGGVDEITVKRASAEELHPIVDAIAKFFSALEVILRPVPKYNLN